MDFMPARKTVQKPRKRRAARIGRKARVVRRPPNLWRARPPLRRMRVARRRAAARAVLARRPLKRSVRRAAARKALHRAALARLRVASAAKALARAGKGATGAMRETTEQTARDAVIAIKAADQAVEAALPHSGDKTEEE